MGGSSVVKVQALNDACKIQCAYVIITSKKFNLTKETNSAIYFVSGIMIYILLYVLRVIFFSTLEDIYMVI